MSPVVLSPEQQRICDTCSPPGVNPRLIRVTAAAGTGKTTTLLALALRAAQNGHTRITYLTFNTSAAADGQRRIHEAFRKADIHGVVADARTLHSCAFRLLKEDTKEGRHEEKVLDDMEIQRLINKHCKDEIDSFLRPCYRTLSRRETKKKTKDLEAQKERAAKQVVFFIFKTLQTFCRSNLSLEDWKNPWTFGRVYYPAQLYHKNGGNGEAAGFEPSVYDSRKKANFYADQAIRFWEDFEETQTHDFRMKRAQLRNLQIPGSILLVDETQDMDACQIAWVTSQPHALVYMVGDAAQTIYSFRGAKSKHLMELSVRAEDDLTLTTSWRFSENIARIANVVLYTKEKSPQTVSPGCRKTSTWKPYRVRGGSLTPCQVTKEGLLHRWREMKITVIARANVSLMVEVLRLLGLSGKMDDDDDMAERPDEIKSDGCHEPPHDEKWVLPLEIPKIHLNGRGESSGMRRWRKVLKEIQDLFMLYLSPMPLRLEAEKFPEFAGRSVSWREFCDDCEDRELRYSVSINVIDAFRARTMEAVNIFKSEVLEKAYSAEEADVILTTCHAAKGMEWDNVHLCDDFVEIGKATNHGTPLVQAESRPRGESSPAGNKLPRRKVKYIKSLLAVQL